ncbi:copper resistance protein B [Caulobacter sp. FWC2]|uniref:copper resistance protein B n=1 Tax=Caulobacter sp. FWC2 TaxID=69664 RepID=UPI000C1607FA|nr:copper resistance protein B [Caulobacter sp. FWC2]PIB92813.1 copper resistance protein CopB [Caulobacter sp. FWC2]
MSRLIAIAAVAALAASPTLAQTMDHSMHGMSMPADPPKAAPKPAAAPASPPAPDNMPGMDMSQGMGGDHAGHAMVTAGEDEAPIPHLTPPPAPTDHAADTFYDPARMAAARAVLREEHGGARYSMVMSNLAEYQARRGGGGYRWEGAAFWGGDINRFVLKSEGEGSFKGGVDAAEVQGLYSRAIGPYFDLQAGVRQDFAPKNRTYLTIGTEGLMPYWFDVSAAAFLSTKGEVLGRVEGTYDLRLTQRLVLQPRAELNFAAQDTAETRTGSGLSNAELGLRLRYEIRREFAPYIGVSFDRRFGRTADYARAAGKDVRSTAFVVGLRAWF